MAEGATTGGSADVAMSEDSGYQGSAQSTTTEGTVSQMDLASESGESTHTVVGQASAAATESQETTENLSWPPQVTIDPVSRTEQWVEETFDVFVKNLDGKTHTIQVEQFEKVSSFKQKVGEKLGVPGEQQRLTSQEGKTLADDNLSLHDYKIKKHSTVYCQGRLRGGQFCLSYQFVLLLLFIFLASLLFPVGVTNCL